jgi:hypothetical protein
VRDLGGSPFAERLARVDQPARVYIAEHTIVWAKGCSVLLALVTSDKGSNEFVRSATRSLAGSVESSGPRGPSDVGVRADHGVVMSRTICGTAIASATVVVLLVTADTRIGAHTPSIAGGTTNGADLRGLTPTADSDCARDHCAGERA